MAGQGWCLSVLVPSHLVALPEFSILVHSAFMVRLSNFSNMAIKFKPIETIRFWHLWWTRHCRSQMFTPMWREPCKLGITLLFVEGIKKLQSSSTKWPIQGLVAELGFQARILQFSGLFTLSCIVLFPIFVGKENHLVHTQHSHNLQREHEK